MQINFSTPKLYRKKLESDFKALKETCNLPCEFLEIFKDLEISRDPDEIAACFYGKNEIPSGIPIIEINSIFYEKPKSYRKLILLHEIIHACQRTNELSKENQFFIVDLSSALTNTVKKYINKHGTVNLEFFKSLVQAIGIFSTWFFEIADELFLKNNYPDLCEEHWQSTYDEISSQYFHYKFEYLGNWEKYIVFVHLVRATYMKNISKSYLVSLKFEDLEKKWNTRLNEITSKEDFPPLKNINSLTMINSEDSNFILNLNESYKLAVNMMMLLLMYDFSLE